MMTAHFLLLLMFGLPAPAAELDWKQLASLPDREGFAAPFAGVSHGALLVAGGASFPGQKPWEGGAKVWYDTVFILETPDASWRVAGKLPRALAYGVSVTTRDGVLCLGGSDAQRHYAEVFLLEWRSGRLRQKNFPALPRPCANMCGLIVSNIAYVAGGIDSPAATNALKTFWALDLSANRPRWKELEPWPGPPRMLAVAGAHDGAFYLFSGADLHGNVRTYLRDAFRYKPGAGWKRLPDLPRPAAAAPSPAPLIDNRLFVMTGDDGSKIGFQPMHLHPGFPRTALAFDPDTARWSEAGELPFSRATVPVVQWQGRFVIPSGEARPGVRSPEVWTLQPAQGN